MVELATYNESSPDATPERQTDNRVVPFSVAKRDTQGKGIRVVAQCDTLMKFPRDNPGKGNIVPLWRECISGMRNATPPVHRSDDTDPDSLVGGAWIGGDCGK